MEYAKAVIKIMENIHILEVEEKPLFKCYGQTLAEDIFSDINVPPTDTSAMDGYAVRAEDVKIASREAPARLHVIETVIAGHLPRKPVKPGTATRIMTGAVMPPGADCVIRFEDTGEADSQAIQESHSEVDIYIPANAGRNVRKIGENVTSGSLILSGGKLIGPGEIAVLTSVGKAKIRVIRRPVIAVLSSGEELISLKRPLSPGKAYDSNTTAIAALVNHYGGVPKILGVARDNEKSILAKIKKGLTADALVSSGGVSRGDYDLIRDVITKTGKVLFSGVEISPGEPFSFGVIEAVPQENRPRVIPFFALAGNPTACMLNFELFVRPSILKMRGYKELSHPLVKAVTEETLSNKKDIQKYLWVKLEKEGEKYRTKLAGLQKRGVLASVANADGLAVIPGNTTVNQGDTVTVMILNWHGDYSG